MIFKTLLASCLLMFSQVAAAKTSETSKANSKMKPQLGTNFRLDGATMYGRYQTPPGTTAVVENDKYLEDLLGARKHFKDRLKKDSERN